MADTNEQARWYSVDREGVAMVCRDEADARENAAGWAQVYPHRAPYRAVQFGDVTAILTERDALAAKLAQAREALAVCERAADMLTAYAELIRRDGASRIDQHHYLPEVEHVAQTLREAKHKEQT